MRKFVVGLISLAALLALYLLYSRTSKTPVIDTDTGAEFAETVTDGNVGEISSEIGKIGGVGVEVLKNPVYQHRGEKGQVDREFGFDELLHKVGDIWEVEKPWMNVYQRSFECYISADIGTTRLETAVGRPTPKDATFTGNVVIHIIPAEGSNVKESSIYLDDVVFLSEKTQFSTGGPVRFVSEDAQMFGIGMELVYNDPMERLEFFRIIDLESLRLKRSQTAFLPGATRQPDREVEAGSQSRTQPPDEPAMVGEPQETQALPATGRRATGQTAGQYYKCVFGKNVVIDTPEQFVFADETVCINDILWSRGSGEKSEEADIDGTDGIKTVRGTADGFGSDRTEIETTTVSEQSGPDGLSEESGDIVVTCDGGVVVAPMDSREAAEDLAKAGAGTTGNSDQRLEKVGDTTGRTTFIARRIDHNAATGDTVASGPSKLTFYSNAASQENRRPPEGASNVAGTETEETPIAITITAQKETRFIADSNQVVFEGDCLCTMPQAGLSKKENATLSSPKLTVNLPGDDSEGSALPDVFAAGPAELTFYVDDFGGAGAEKTPVPAKVTAQKQARFLAVSNQVVFDGDCRCTMLRQDPNVLSKYILSSQQLVVDLPKDTNDQSSTSAAGIEHLMATGGVVRLATVRTAQEKVLSGIELKCNRFDYDAGRQLFVASGPGSITLDNSTVAEPNEQPGGFSLKGPCWAIIEDFKTLKYFMASNKIVAEAESVEGLVVNYFPIREGKFTEHIIVNAGHVEADLAQAADGRTELSTLTASDRVTYEDEENEFVGSELFYNHKESVMKVRGDESARCYFNGALVEGIELNSKTRRVEAKVVAPGALQLNR